jgi:hypothetical protein
VVSLEAGSASGSSSGFGFGSAKNLTAQRLLRSLRQDPHSLSESGSNSGVVFGSNAIWQFLIRFFVHSSLAPNFCFSSPTHSNAGGSQTSSVCISLSNNRGTAIYVLTWFAAPEAVTLGVYSADSFHACLEQVAACPARTSRVRPRVHSAPARGEARAPGSKRSLLLRSLHRHRRRLRSLSHCSRGTRVVLSCNQYIYTGCCQSYVLYFEYIVLLFS